MKTIFYLCILGAVLFSFGCGGNNSATSADDNLVVAKTNANLKPEPPRNPQTPFENALFSVRVGDFEQVLVFRRRDGSIFTSQDKQFLRNNQPSEQGREVNRWRQCEDEKCFVAGTNFKFTRANLVALLSRFDVKDYSKGDGVEVILPEESPVSKNENTNK
ncbi:MAG: hypothetical protein ABI954_15475 [Pyrinomonadaceae bacterium]